MKRSTIKREVDFQVISSWIGEGSRVLDLGCGRGILLEHLAQAKGVYAVGVDIDPSKVASCVRRGVSVFQGDILAVLRDYPDRFFDWVICSRTLQDLARPSNVILEALRVSRRLAVGFVNHGFWLNRAHLLLHGSRLRNEVFPDAWYATCPTHPISVRDFEGFCREHGIAINRRACLDASWQKPCRRLPNLLAGYVIYDLSGGPAGNGGVGEPGGSGGEPR